MGWFSQSKGKVAEQAAAIWLKQQGLTLLQQNYRCKGGEIDLIGLDGDQTLVFIEVKARKNQHFGHPAEAVDARKQKHLILCAQVFLQKHPQYQHHAMRFDILSLTDNQTPEWLKNAFGAY